MECCFEIVENNEIIKLVKWEEMKDGDNETQTKEQQKTKETRKKYIYSKCVTFFGD